MSYFETVWQSHVVETLSEGNDLLFIDRVVAHEITTPPGALQIQREFDGRLYDSSRIVAINDHVSPAKDTASAIQAQFLRTWAGDHRIDLYDVGDNGICHVLVPERGLALPGMTMCCGDSHTCTLGAFGAVALGVGTTGQAGAMLSGCIVVQRPRVIHVAIRGALRPPASAKDIALTIVARLRGGDARGCALELSGPTIEAMTMEERMTVCNMAIEAGATTAVVKPDAVTWRYLEARNVDLPSLERWFDFEYAGAQPKAEIDIDAAAVEPLITWGTNPAESVALDEAVPFDASAASVKYMGVEPGVSLHGLKVDQVFIGSCTNSRLNDLRVAAEIIRGKRVRIPTIITPGSQAVKRSAEHEGLHDVFQDAGALWTHASCGPCLGMSMGVLAPGMRCVSTSNRNFPGRMGADARVHLASPAVAAASAVLGRIPTTSELRELVEDAVCK